jgi:hypothetical protein
MGKKKGRKHLAKTKKMLQLKKQLKRNYPNAEMVPKKI